MMRRRDLEDVKYEFNGETRILGPKDRLDKSMSPRVGDFAQKSYPRPNYPGRDSRITLDSPIIRQFETQIKS